MDVSSAPSLLSIATAKVALLLYNDSELRKSANYSIIYDLEDFNEEWRQSMHDKASRLHIPVHLHENLANEFIRICMHIRQNNIELHAMHWYVSLMVETPCQCLKELLPSSYRWTSDACIDIPRTVQALVQDRRVDLVFRFILSCDFMLDIEVVSLWNLMPDTMQNRVFESDLMFRVKEFLENFILNGDMEDL